MLEDKGTWWSVKRPHYVDAPPVYIVKEATGTELEIPLTNEDLNEVYSELPGEEAPEPYSNIEVSLVTKAEFEARKKTAKEHLTMDTPLEAKPGEFSLKIGGKLKKFKDEPGHAYEYLGQFKKLNKYLVVFTWYEAEESTYDLIDRTTGKPMASLEGMPYFSRDQKMIMCLEPNINRDFAHMFVYTATQDTAMLYTFGEFRNWMPAESADKFWASDGCFYLPVLPSVAYYQTGDPAFKDRPADYNYRYVKIRIKGPTVVTEEVIPYYPNNKFDPYDALTETLPFEKRIAWTDSIRKATDARLPALTKTKHPNSNNTYCFWKGEELVAIQSHNRDEKTDNVAKWYYHQGKFILMDHAVTYRDSGKPFTEDKYYGYEGRIFAWKKFGNFVHPSYKHFNVVVAETGHTLAGQAR